MQNILILIIPIIMAAAAQILFKKGIAGLAVPDFSFSGIFSLIPKILQSPWLVSGMILFGMSFLIYLFVLAKLQLNIAYPIFVSAGVILISLASYFIFKETLSWVQLGGVVFIIFGIFLLATKG